MRDVTRRGFLKNTSVGAMAIGALAAMPSIASAAERSQASGQPAPVSVMPMSLGSMAAASGVPDQPFAVFIRNPAAGEITLMYGEQELVFTDPALVQQLWDAATA